MIILVAFVGFVFLLTVFALLYLLFRGGEKPKKNIENDDQTINDAENINEETATTNRNVYNSTTQTMLDNGFTETDIKELTQSRSPCIFYPSRRVYMNEADAEGNYVKTYLDEKDPDLVSGSSFKVESTCPDGMEYNSETTCCKWEKIDLTLLDKVMTVAPILIESIVISYIFEKMIIVMRKLYPRSFGSKLIKLKSKMGKIGKTLGNFSKKAMFEAGEKISLRSGRSVGRIGGKKFVSKMTIQGAKLAAKNTAKLAYRSSIKGARTVGTKLMAASAPCMPCTAAVIAFEIVSAALDISDIQGYSTYTANTDVRNIRNQAETAMEQAMYDSDGVSWPQLFPILTAFPDLDEPTDGFGSTESTESTESTTDEFTVSKENGGYASVLLEAFTADAMLKMAMDSPDSFVEMLVYAFTSDSDEDVEISEATTTMFAEILQAEMDYNHIKRDKIIYNLCVSRGYGDQVEFIESMSSETVIGVTLNEEGAKLYNERMVDQHLKYSNPAVEINPDDIPDEYVPLVAAYTDTYRKIDKLNPGNSQTPNVIEEKLDRKMALMMPWAAIMYNCLGDKRGTSASYFTINPADHGTTFNYDKGYCNYTEAYCKGQMKLDYRNGDCHLSQSQRVAEVILGETVTRAVKGSWDDRKDNFNSGDPSRVVAATFSTLFDPTGLWTAAATDIINLIKASKGRGAGVIPIKCKDDEVQKGQLCYPKCRDGYRSSALECEGVCPPGSRNTGLTCLQSTRTKSCFLWEKTSRCEKRFKDADGNPIGVRSKGASTVAKPCLPGFTRRSYALGSAFCDKPRNRYTRAFMAKLKSKCPDSKPNKQNGLCYKDCPEGYPRARGPICMKEKST